MNFSAVQKIGLAQWSPNGKYLAVVDKNRVLVRAAETLGDLMQVYVCVDKVTRLEWSSSSDFILAEVARAGVVQVWHAEESAWQCRIDEGLAGVAFASWGISSRHVFVVADFQLHLSVWDIQDRNAPLRIRYPKFAGRGLAFSHSKRWFALLRRVDCRDRVAVHLASGDFAKVSDFIVQGDFQAIVWTQMDSCILLWERPSASARFMWYAPNGQMLQQVEQCGLLRFALPSASAQLIAAGCIDGRLRIIDTSDKKVISILDHNLPACLSECTEGEEPEVLREERVGVGAEVQVPRYMQISKLKSVKVPEEKVSAERCKVDSLGAPCLGVSEVQWSPDARYVATQHEAMPTAVWVWDIGHLRLCALLLHSSPVRSFGWDPTGWQLGNAARLAITTASSEVFVWSAKGRALAARSPLSMARLQWCSTGRQVLLQEGGRGCILSIAAQDDSEN
mmetsp:Transcript_64576/g.154287  ORF Transcript_64576/g.154287 Transcript_64576/m.154287 type:complete len:450 (+) Transcript_64576:166-1515(+)|eukprot:CAMPEP_0178418964 /NCGR_PEP_ID=MMETSP0689_2-20121128/25360_1 /TAXON_ID=160604 /ORGANISM="Amphidinium massartii, Strain CS-259" /LENGTH=449 /DNA_ID=CAMNT_0020040375 /DNA_START=97 /DNA_END=1446 /DNA_ORIENTATION=-